ncbi:MAG: hypothetical protein JWO63_1643 [Frankiales bacterium]|nr:hypothetical protein [Frankiales bacterium]
MYFFASGSIINPSGMASLQEEEDRILNELREAGTVQAAFKFAEKHGVIGIFEGTSLVAVQAQIERLPFVAGGVMTFEYTEIVAL